MRKRRTRKGAGRRNATGQNRANGGEGVGQWRRGRGLERRCLLLGRRGTLRLEMHSRRYSKNEGVEEERIKRRKGEMEETQL